MSAWPTDERITPKRRPRPRRWLAFALLSFIAIFVIAGIGPELEEGQDLPAPWAVPFVLALVGTAAGLVGAGVSAIRARRSRAEAPPSEEERATRPGRQGLYLALGGLAIIIVTMTVWQAVVEPDPGDDLGPIEGTFATIGVCAVILGLAYWGMGKGQRAAERRMVRNLEGADRIEPTEDEEASLQRAFADAVRRGRDPNWAVTAVNPTDVRQAELTLLIDPGAARSRGEAALVSLGAEAVVTQGDLVRGSWFHGGHLNGNPVVVTLAFAPDGLGGTRMTVRSAAKFYLTNQDLAKEALDRVLAAFDVREHATT